MSARTGQCLCGAVTFVARVDNPEIQLCHCVQCQRWTGGGPLSVVQVSDVDLSGVDHIRHYHASEWGERGFCDTCGATIYWRMRGKPLTDMPAGLFDDQSGLSVTEEIFVDHRPPWIPPWPDARQSTEAQEMQKLQDYLEGDAQ